MRGKTRRGEIERQLWNPGQLLSLLLYSVCVCECGCVYTQHSQPLMRTEPKLNNRKWRMRMRNKNKSVQRSLCFQYASTEYTKYQSVSSHKSHTQENIINQLPLSAMQKVLVSCVSCFYHKQRNGIPLVVLCEKIKNPQQSDNSHFSLGNKTRTGFCG